MSILRSTLLIIFVLSLVNGCSSPASQIKYYELNSANQQFFSSSTERKKPILLLSLQVPDYMRQSKLVMRTAPNTMHFSANSLWAQLPEKEFYSALIMDLNQGNADYTFISNKGPDAYAHSGSSLYLEVTHFYPTENAEVVLNGYWTLTEIKPENDGSARRAVPFSIKLPLEKDGFAHAVGKQRHLISKLAAQILAQMNSQ